GQEPRLEALTQDYGREIFARLGRQSLFPFTPGWWDERLMEWTMAEQALKVQLFRFIDVLPLLKAPEAINRHLREYFLQAKDELPGWVNRLVRHVPQDGLVGKVLAGAARQSAVRLAHRFIAGSTLDEALRAIAEMRRRSLAFTVDLLGEATITEAEALAYQ